MKNHRGLPAEDDNPKDDIPIPHDLVLSGRGESVPPVPERRHPVAHKRTAKDEGIALPGLEGYCVRIATMGTHG
jgi:hypothetical protein